MNRLSFPSLLALLLAGAAALRLALSTSRTGHTVAVAGKHLQIK